MTQKTKRVWCVAWKAHPSSKQLHWCATFRGHRPDESATSDRTACGMYVILRVGSEKRVPTCSECIERVRRRRS